MDAHLRQSNFSNYSDDLEEDRRLINQKLQLRRSKQQNYQEEEEDDQSVLDYYNNTNSSGRNNNFDLDSSIGYYNNDIADTNDNTTTNNIDVDEEQYLLRQAHAQDEQLIGGKVSRDDTEGLEALNQALTSPPVAWWAKRKQWQKKRRIIGGGFGGGMGMTSSARSGLGMEEGEADPNNIVMMGNDHEDMNMMNMMGNDGGEHQPYVTEEGVLGHPVMLTDPTALGYDTTAFRHATYGVGGIGGGGGDAYANTSSSSNNKKKRGPTVLYVPRAAIKRRSAQQVAYILSALCVVFLFMFFLEQLKLAQYAMVESPVPLSAYLAGEDRQDYDEVGKVTLGSLGLEEFDGKIQGIPVVEFGKIQLDRDDPLLAQETAAAGSPGGKTAAEDEQQSAGILHGADYFEILKGVITGWGITPAEVFVNELSPQYKALHWMAYEDILRRQPESDFQIKKIIQRYALSVIYFATAGELWRHSALFLSNLDECSWNMKVEPKYFLGAGGCEGGFVTRLDLWGNHLTVSVGVGIAVIFYFTSFLLS
jgi:hypothetical protein